MTPRHIFRIPALTGTPHAVGFYDDAERVGGSGEDDDIDWDAEIDEEDDE
ncbi:hypothetical protein [Falsiroseomonas sp. HW251]